MIPARPGEPMHVAEWVARSGISIVFACGLLWWVLAEQSKALERIASQQVAMAQALDRLNQRIDLTCPPVCAEWRPAMSSLDWASTPSDWEWLKRCAKRHCPHRHLKIDWDDCPCPMHTYMRTQDGLDALAKANRNRAVHVANEWRSGGNVSTTRRD